METPELRESGPALSSNTSLAQRSNDDLLSSIIGRRATGTRRNDTGSRGKGRGEAKGEYPPAASEGGSPACQGEHNAAREAVSRRDEGSAGPQEAPTRRAGISRRGAGVAETGHVGKHRPDGRSSDLQAPPIQPAGICRRGPGVAETCHAGTHRPDGRSSDLQANQAGTRQFLEQERKSIKRTHANVTH